MDESADTHGPEPNHLGQDPGAGDQAEQGGVGAGQEGQRQQRAEAAPPGRVGVAHPQIGGVGEQQGADEDDQARLEAAGHGPQHEGVGGYQEDDEAQEGEGRSTRRTTSTTAATQQPRAIASWARMAAVPSRPDSRGTVATACQAGW